jgi:hypothetical protein
MPKEKEVNLFTFLNQIQSKRRTVPYDKKIANAWMLSQWLSHDKDLVERVSRIVKYQQILPDDVIYEYYMDSIPAGRRYIKWVKKRKQDEKLKERIKKLQELEPKLSERECMMIISFLQAKKRRKE